MFSSDEIEQALTDMRCPDIVDLTPQIQSSRNPKDQFFATLAKYRYIAKLETKTRFVLLPDKIYDKETKNCIDIKHFCYGIMGCLVGQGVAASIACFFCKTGLLGTLFVAGTEPAVVALTYGGYKLAVYCKDKKQKENRAAFFAELPEEVTAFDDEPVPVIRMQRRGRKWDKTA